MKVVAPPSRSGPSGHRGARRSSPGAPRAGRQGVFLAVFLSTAYTPQPLLRGWLGEVAGFNPVTHVLELARQATVAGIEPSLAHTLPGVLALLGMGLIFGSICLIGVRRMGR